MIQAAWRAVVCPKCDAPIGERCGTVVKFMGFGFLRHVGGTIHVARVTAGKSARLRKGRHTGGRNKA
jgi:hypothetical protein